MLAAHFYFSGIDRDAARVRFQHKAAFFVDVRTDTADLAVCAAIASGLEFDESPQEMDAEGTVRFDGLSVGLYLVMQAKKGTGSDEFTIEPFLISIPRRNPDGTLLYDVTGESKPINVAWNPPREPDQPDKPKKPSKLPQTGQLWWPVMALGAAGALFVLAGAAAKRRK